MDEIIQKRVNTLKNLVDTGINPYEITKFDVNINSKEAKEKYSYLNDGEESNDYVKYAGRIKAIRKHGKLGFLDVEDREGKLQIMVRKDISKEAFKTFDKYLDEGDIIGVEGKIIRSKRGEITILANKIVLLSKALRPIPHEWYGIKDVEIRYKQRYLDFMINKEKRDIIINFSKIVKSLRETLDNKGFIEVFTPILQPIYGGAFAKPFKTFHNFLEQEMYLRIAPELYLKRLLVGGFEKVYEIGPCFRNESVDSRHNPEFIQIEAYEAYANYEDGMNLVEEMIKNAAERVTKNGIVKINDKEIDFFGKWERIPMIKAIEKIGGIKIPKDEEELRELAKELNIKGFRKGDIIEEIFSEYVEKKLINPTFITEFPADISPLAKKIPNNKDFAERYELYIAGMEVANGYSELNNPAEQYLRFKEEEELRAKIRGDELEYMPMDKDYIRALEYAMPPASGLGIGLARLGAIMSGYESIKEVIPFPTVKKEENIELVVEKDEDLRKKISH